MVLASTWLQLAGALHCVLDGSLFGSRGGGVPVGSQHLQTEAGCAAVEAQGALVESCTQVAHLNTRCDDDLLLVLLYVRR